jgi:hypothetical protein
MLKKILRKPYIYLINKFQPLISAFKLIPSYIVFIKDYRDFKKQFKLSGRESVISWKESQPCLHDKTNQTPFDNHYTYHPAWAARVLKEINPKEHVDISSILSFSTIVSAFIPIKFYDYRPAAIKLDNLQTGKADLQALPFSDNSIESLSCLHTIEHIGLGRYGDPVDVNADIKAISELKRVLKKGGNFLFVTPIGKSKIKFNAHRIYSYAQIMDYFSDLTLKEFSLVTDSSSSSIVKNASKELADQQNYGCGCFWFTK